MPATNRHLNVSTSTQLILAHPGNTTPPQSLQSCLSDSGIAVASIADLEMLKEHLTHESSDVILVAADWRTAQPRDFVTSLREVAPHLPILAYGEVADSADNDLSEDGIFGPVLPSDSLATLLGWIATAKASCRTRHDLVVAQQAIIDLGQLTAQLSAPYQFDTLLDSILNTLLQIISREMMSQQVTMPCGAILLTGSDGRIVVHAATDSYLAYLHQPLPEEIQSRVIQTAESRSTMANGHQLIIPFYWNDSLHAILVVEGEGLPTVISETLMMVVTHISVVLENALLFELAAVDTTTRAFTRAFTLQRLYESLKSTYRTGQELTILMMDLDRFKNINDTYGHLTGDLALHKVGELMRSALRETDILGRYGGDEFLLILPNTPIAGALEVANRLMQFITDFRLNVNGEEVSLGISIGIGGIRHGDSDDTTKIRPRHEFFQESMKMLIAQADGLMYRAKHSTSTHIATGHAMSWSNLIQRGLVAGAPSESFDL